MTSYDVKQWDDGDRHQVAMLILEGKSCRDIGAILDLTRNAVIGRIHRDETLRPLLTKFGRACNVTKAIQKAASKPKPKPKPKPAPVPKSPPRPPAAAPMPKNWRGTRHIFGDLGPWEEREALATRKPAPKPERRLKPLMELARAECRFPVAEDEAVVGRFLFCSDATLPEAVYCAHHAQRCHTPSLMRRRA